ncbi:hypothetical protein RCO28_19790 [Streptomyces sp. LHD-70]|uniref:hypothetical protein n=1 Tax=Streptomyces sp. LHD-70 TaxID=3072140 RepID=UPI00280E9643|nr:hypothetical protein [Streptomyces sp. LHD-70]MDQ8704717.1 hypothetical protein [Streptomyces sp. LHD-70]
MGLTVKTWYDSDDGGWSATGDDGSRTVTLTADSADEAGALVREAFGFKAYRPPPPLPPGRHRFSLVHCPVGPEPGPGASVYDALRAEPPEGCVVEDFGHYFGLRCERPGKTLLDAVGVLCAEIREEHGLLMTDLGIEKLWEWSSDGTDGWGAAIVGQLLLMAAERAPELGYGPNDLVRLLRRAMGE